MEQRNGSIVRRVIGYDRYENEKAWQLLCEFYAILRLYVNFFQPSVKLVDKNRAGCKTTKKYDKAKTPYQRVMESLHVTPPTKAALTKQYHHLDPILLKEKLETLQKQLSQEAWQGEEGSVVEKSEQSNSQEMEERQPKFYYRKKKPKTKCLHHWRTRLDPFKNIYHVIELELQLDPSITAKALLEKLITRYPGDYCRGHLRTLQRRIKEMRENQNKRAEQYQQIMVKQKHMTTDPMPVTI